MTGSCPEAEPLSTDDDSCRGHATPTTPLLMAIEIRSHRSQDSEAIGRFNQRLIAGGWTDFHLPTTTIESTGLADSGEKRWFVASDGDEVRGGLMLQQHELYAGGGEHPGANLQAPLAEGVVTPRYAAVGPLLIRWAMRERPLLYAVGMGAADRPLPRLLGALRWSVQPVPFYFRIARPARALRELRLPSSRAARIARLIGGVPLLGAAAFRFVHRTRGPVRGSVGLSPVREWGPWADAVWDEARGGIDLAFVRRSPVLKRLYPVGGRVECFQVVEGGRLIGWIALLDTRMKSSPHFGDLRVGTLLDGLVSPGYEGAAVRAARKLLTARGVDLVVTNQLHPDWVRAVENDGFKSGPSNYLLALAPALVEAAKGGTRILVNRGDGDGRIHL